MLVEATLRLVAFGAEALTFFSGITAPLAPSFPNVLDNKEDNDPGHNGNQHMMRLNSTEHDVILS